MGAFSNKQDVTIPRTPEEGVKWGWEPHESVTLKGKFTIGDAEFASTTSTDAAGNNVTSASSVKMMLRMIRSWTLTGDNPTKFADISERNIEELETEYVKPIMDEIGKINTRGQVADPKAS